MLLKFLIYSWFFRFLKMFVIAAPFSAGLQRFALGYFFERWLLLFHLAP